MNKDCATGNRAATQGNEWPLPCPEPLSRGWGHCLHSPLHLGAAEQLQSVPPFLVQSFEQLHREGKALGRGTQGLGKGPPKLQHNCRGGITLGTVSMPSPGTHKTGCLSGELLPQFPSWYGPPRSSASGTHGFRRQLSSYENFHSPFLSSNQVHRIRGRDLPDLSPPSHPQAQPTCRCSLEVLSAPLLVEVSIHHYIQPEWEPELDKHSRVSQGTSEPGKSSVSSSACACPDARGQAGCGILQRGVCRHGQGWGDPSHNHHPGSPGSTQDKQP